ncbi:nuclease-related domain-containing protein [Streptomyces sp. NPDC001668]|uniref:nuclease-related domain-containing protein n=1 Tax=Streptomyces sp. NPDC001668 TaxID=3364598 RepID=UPI00369AEB14
MAARERAVERAQQHRRARWILPTAGVGAGAAGYFAAEVTRSYPFAVALACTFMLAALRRVYRSRGSSWAKGAAGERRTARILAPLTWFGFYAVLHDRAVPRSRANLDHVLIGRRGLVYIDTKNWMSENARIRVDSRGRLWCGNYCKQDDVDTVRWEASQVAAALGWPAHAVIAVHGATVPGGVVQLDGVTVVQAAVLRRYLRRLPKAPGWNRAMVRETVNVADQRLQPAAATGRPPRASRRRRRPSSYPRRRARKA